VVVDMKSKTQNNPDLAATWINGSHERTRPKHFLPWKVMMLNSLWGQMANSSGLSRWPRELASWQPPCMVAWATTMPSLSAPPHPHPIHEPNKSRLWVCKSRLWPWTGALHSEQKKISLCSEMWCLNGK
jgi:hypothetical protein